MFRHSPSFIPPNPLTSLRPPPCRISTSPILPPPVMCAPSPPDPFNHPIDSCLFRIHFTVMPVDTDYSFALWHGAYIRYMEEARVRYLNHIDVPYDVVVRDHATELVVHELSLKYLAPARMGDELAVTVDLLPSESSLRIPVESKFVKLADGTTVATGLVTLVAIDTSTGKPRRKLPRVLREAFGRSKGQVESG